MSKIAARFVEVLFNPRVTDPVEYLMFLNAHFSFFSLAMDWFESKDTVVLDDGCVINAGRGFSLSEGICGYNVDELKNIQGGFLEVLTSFQIIRANTILVTCLCYLIFMLRLGFKTRWVWINVFCAGAALLAVVNVIIYINLVNSLNILQSDSFSNFGPGFIFHVLVVTFSFSILGIEFYRNFDDI
jgi:hypothetical protein